MVKGMEFQGIKSSVAIEKPTKIKTWNKEDIENMEERKKQALKNLMSWDALDCIRLLNQNQLDLKAVELENF